MITVTQRPSTTISGETSKWNAVNNPVVYKMTTDEYAQPNYRLEVEVYNAANELLNVAFSYLSDPDGDLFVDISTILKSNLLADFDGVLTGVTKTFDDSNVYLKFYIKYQEVWTGSAESQTNDSANQFFAVLGGNQIPAPYGGNLAEYVTFNDGGPAAKWLTEFETLKFWRGYPQLVSVIVGDGVGANVFFEAEGDVSTPESAAGKILSVDLNNLLTSQDSFQSMDLNLYKDASPDVLLTETLTITLEDGCDGQIMLQGRNKRGGVISWMFDVGNEYSFDYGNGIKAARKVLRTSNLTLNQWEALQDFITLGPVYRNNIIELLSTTIKTSSRVGNQVYVIDEAGTKTGVVVIPSTNQTNTRYNKHLFELEIEYPEIL